GLSIASHLVNMMGGEIRVESTTGKGSTFSFQISLPAKTQEAESRLTTELAGRQFLIVDDNVTHCDFLKDALIRAGALANAVPDTASAVHQLGNTPASDSVLLLDAEMLNVDGAAFLSDLRNKGAFSGTIVAMMSAGKELATAQRY